MLAYYEEHEDDDLEEVNPRDPKLDCLRRIVSTSTLLYRCLPGYESLSLGFDRFALELDCDEVYPGLFIGDRRTATNKTYLGRIGVTHILNVAEDPGHGLQNALYYQGSNMSYMGIPLLDNETYDISPYFHVTANYIDRGVMSGGNVLVHCQKGISRSSAIVASFLMIKYGLTAPLALTLICQKRKVRPNDGFLEQLIRLENNLNNH